MSLFGLKFGKKKLKGECGLVIPLSWEQGNVNIAHVQILVLLFGSTSGPEQVGEDTFSFLFLHFKLPWRSGADWVPVNGGTPATGPATEFVHCRDT